MGIIQPDYLIVEGAYSDEDKKILDDWISELPEEWRILFNKCPAHSNGEIIYFMNWDGSKEGWESSERGNSLREQFIKLCLENEISCIYHIKTEGELCEEGRMDRRDSFDEEKIGLYYPCVVCKLFEEVDDGICQSCKDKAIKGFKGKFAKKQNGEKC